MSGEKSLQNEDKYGKSFVYEDWGKEENWGRKKGREGENNGFPPPQHENGLRVFFWKQMVLKTKNSNSRSLMWIKILLITIVKDPQKTKKKKKFSLHTKLLDDELLQTTQHELIIFSTKIIYRTVIRGQNSQWKGQIVNLQMVQRKKHRRNFMSGKQMSISLSVWCQTKIQGCWVDYKYWFSEPNFAYWHVFHLYGLWVYCHYLK